MKYIVISPTDLTATVVPRKPQRGFVVPLEFRPDQTTRSPIENIIYMEVLYPARYAEDRKRGIANQKYKLLEPDPWLIAIGIIMWQGIVQGLAWNSVKFLVNKALCSLRRFGAAPKPSAEISRARRRTSLEFCWTEYSESGRRQREMFISMRREFDRMSPHEIQTVCDSRIERMRLSRFPEHRNLKGNDMATLVNQLVQRLQAFPGVETKRLRSRISFWRPDGTRFCKIEPVDAPDRIVFTDLYYEQHKHLLPYSEPDGDGRLLLRLSNASRVEGAFKLAQQRCK